MCGDVFSIPMGPRNGGFFRNPLILLFGAGNGIRTRDPRLGKPMLYQLSYARLV